MSEVSLSLGYVSHASQCGGRLCLRHEVRRSSAESVLIPMISFPTACARKSIL